MDLTVISVLLTVFAVLAASYFVWGKKDKNIPKNEKKDGETSKSKSETESEKTKGKKRRPRKKKSDIPRSEMNEEDIENLLSKSLVPFTRKRMKVHI